MDGVGRRLSMPLRYFEAAEAKCPRCHAVDYIPLLDAHSRERRLCVSCNLMYAPGDHETEEGPRLAEASAAHPHTYR